MEKNINICEFVYLQCAENKDLQEKVNILEQRLASAGGDKLSPSSKQCMSEEYAEELKKKVQSQVISLDHLKAFYSGISMKLL